MELRIFLDEQFDAALIARITQKANGGSRNKAARFLMRYWFENENVRNMTGDWPETNPKLVGIGTRDGGLDDAWSGLEEDF